VRLSIPWTRNGRRGAADGVPPAATSTWQPVVLECIGARLYSYVDRIVVEWPEGPKVELASAWCADASIDMCGSHLFRISLRFMPPDRHSHGTRGGVDLTLLAPTRLLPLAKTIARNLKERGARQIRARQANSEKPTEPTDNCGIVRDAEWIGFKPNPDTEELLSESEREPRPTPDQ
jgi:hypothetical protein